jgi:hypothetical protein
MGDIYLALKGVVLGMTKLVAAHNDMKRFKLI